MEERKIYKKEELKALREWFASQNLPQSLQVDKATYIPNLKETVEVCSIRQKFVLKIRRCKAA